MADGSDLKAYSKSGDGKSHYAAGSAAPGRKKKKSDKRPAKIAFSGEEYGFGYQALTQFSNETRRRVKNGRSGVYDGGAKAAKNAKLDQDTQQLAQFDDFNFAEAPRQQAVRTKEQALMAVKSGTADYALVPFYNPYAGYDFETLRALNTLTGMMAVEQYVASDSMCLAVHESQVLELAQSSHPGSSFSSLMRHTRRQGNLGDADSYKNDHSSYASAPSGAGIRPNAAEQSLLRDRIDMIFAGPEAARRCKSSLDGFRSIGVDIVETPRVIEPHRELAKRARSSLTSGRQVNTFFDPRSGDSHFVNSMGSDAHHETRLYGVLIPSAVADRSPEYIIIDEDVDDSAEEKSRFFVVHKNPDHSLFEDAYRTTDAKTRYWEKRIKHIARRAQDDVHVLGDEKNKIKGVRVMLRFLRGKHAASVGDVENYLRNYGVPFNIVRVDEDSGASEPAPVVMDIEFSFADGDFGYYPFSRRFRGSVVNGALKKAFARWKNRGVLVLAAMPFEEPQLPRHKQRRWWKEAFIAQQKDFTETMFIRFSRILFIYMLPLGIAALLLWVLMKQFTS